MKTLLALLLLIPNLSWGDWCGSKNSPYIWEDRNCNDITHSKDEVDFAKGVIRILDGKKYYDKKEIKKSSSNNIVSKETRKLDKQELKEQLTYWKSLLDDELISKKDYEIKKNELINSFSTKSTSNLDKEIPKDKDISSIDNEIQILKNALSKTKKKNCKKESAGMQYYKDKQCKTLKCKNNQIKNLRAELNNCGGYGKSDEDIFYEAVGGAIMSIFD